jgi:hypothetical protein
MTLPQLAVQLVQSCNLARCASDRDTWVCKPGKAPRLLDQDLTEYVFRWCRLHSKLPALETRGDLSDLVYFVTLVLDTNGKHRP